MANVDVYNLQKEKVAETEIADSVFNAEIKEHLVRDVVVWQLAKRRQGSAAVKNRAKVKGGGAKPWKQKGTGRARAGTSRSPIWRGGGAIFGPQPRDYGYRLPKQVRRQALISVLSQKFQEGKVFVLQDLALDSVKTQKVAELFTTFGVKSAILVAEDNRELTLSARNLNGALAVNQNGVNVYDLLKYDYLILSDESLKKIEGALQK
ncbi:MAG: 50S ribosomal protein L4 [Deltaproteobacteria bacterium]|nr:MAG: 50S ribosomal protein L4 [Deltaproteobacteria bacterium]